MKDEHPDFRKLQEVASRRMELRAEINSDYKFICDIAFNEKITSLYVNYLEAIENDEELYQSILEGIKEEHNL